jgi:hypothetical protein
MPPKKNKHANKKRATAPPAAPRKRAKDKPVTSDVLQAYRRDSCGDCGMDTGRYPWFRTQQTMMDDKGQPWFSDKTGKQWPVLSEFKFTKADCPKCTREAAIKKYHDQIHERAEASLKKSVEVMSKLTVEDLSEPKKPEVLEKGLKIDDLPDDKFVEAMNEISQYEKEKKRREDNRQQFTMVKDLEWDRKTSKFIVKDSADKAPMTWEIVTPEEASPAPAAAKKDHPDLHIEIPAPGDKALDTPMEPSIPRAMAKARSEYDLLKSSDMS